MLHPVHPDVVDASRGVPRVVDDQAVSVHGVLHQANRERIPAKAKAWRQANKAKALARDKKYCERYREKTVAYMKEYRQKNRERLDAYREWRKKKAGNP